MATYCTQIDNTKKARALQIQGSGLHRSTQKCWNFRLTIYGPMKRAKAPGKTRKAPSSK